MNRMASILIGIVALAMLGLLIYLIAPGALGLEAVLYAAGVMLLVLGLWWFIGRSKGAR